MLIKPDEAEYSADGIEQKPKLTPLKAVRKYCLWCCCDSAPEVRLCPAESCELHPLRFGKGARRLGLIPVRVIRQKCLDCVCGSIKEVKWCPFDDSYYETCPLFEYRMGKNPNIKPDHLPPESSRLKKGWDERRYTATPGS